MAGQLRSLLERSRFPFGFLSDSIRAEREYRRETRALTDEKAPLADTHGGFATTKEATTADVAVVAYTLHWIGGSAALGLGAAPLIWVKPDKLKNTVEDWTVLFPSTPNQKVRGAHPQGNLF